MTSERSSLEDIDRQLNDAVSFCKSEGLSTTEVTKSAKPILDWANRKRRGKRLRNFLKFALLVAVAAFLWESETSYRWLSIGLKMLQMQLLPYWDWTSLFEISCVVSNPYYVGDLGPTEQDCKWMNDYQDVHRLKGLSHDNMTNNYILRNLPVIVTDATAAWPATEKFSFLFLQKLYLEDEVYKDCRSCTFVANIPTLGKTEFLKSINTYDSFNSYWMNCEVSCMKSFRKYYRRPYFIPPMVGSSQQNFVIAGKVSEDKSATLVAAQNFPAVDKMTWISQIRGQLHVTLRSECKGVRDIEEIISAGDTLAFNNNIWWLSYRSTGGGESIALGSTGSWDN